MGKVYGYIRNARGSVLGQVLEMVEYAKENNIEFAGIYVDTYASGNNVNRNGLNELIDNLETEDVVLATSLDRVSRNIVNYHKIVTAIEDKGATLKLAKEPYGEEYGFRFKKEKISDSELNRRKTILTMALLELINIESKK